MCRRSETWMWGGRDYGKDFFFLSWKAVERVWASSFVVVKKVTHFPLHVSCGSPYVILLYSFSVWDEKRIINKAGIVWKIIMSSDFNLIRWHFVTNFTNSFYMSITIISYWMTLIAQYLCICMSATARIMGCSTFFFKLLWTNSCPLSEWMYLSAPYWQKMLKISKATFSGFLLFKGHNIQNFVKLSW